MSIRMATPEDAEQLLRIYAPYILETTVTFEYEVPEVEEFRERIESVMEKYPWLVWEENDQILGYAYAGALRSRMAFSWDCELSVYIRPDAVKRGIGKKLYHVLLKILKELGYYKAYALICVPNEASEKLHESFGFWEEGRLLGTGFKFGKWLDLSYQVKELRDETNLPDTLPKTIWEL